MTRHDAAWKRRAAVGALYGALALVFCSPLFEHPNALGGIDWDEKLSYYGAVLKTVIEYGQLPFWNPWKCGGGVLWQNPLVPLLAPAYPLSAVMSVALAMKIEILLHYWIGFIGMHLLLTEAIGLAFAPIVMYLASIFVLCGALVLHLQVGHSVFMPAFYLPWLLFFVIRAMKTGLVRDALMGGGVLALTIYNAGLHMVSMVVVAIATLSFVAAFVRRSWTPIVLGAVVGISGALYSAPKLIPIVNFVTAKQFWDTRGAPVHPDRMTLEMVLRTYLDPYQYGHLMLDPLQRANWWEYGNYIGLPAALLIVSSLVWIAARARRSQQEDAWLGWALGVSTLLLLVWSAGEFSPFAPASIGNHVWFLSRFRIPSRFTVAFGLLGATLVGWTLKTVLPPRDKAANSWLLAGVLCTFATAQLLYQNGQLFTNVFSLPAVESSFKPLRGVRDLAVDRTSDPYAPKSPMFRALMNDTAFYKCYESFQLTHSADPDHALVYTTGDARIVDVKFSPNRVQFSVLGGTQPSLILLNQNYAPGWSSTAGPVVIDQQSGKPAVLLAAGQMGKFAFTFTAPGVLVGLLIMIAAAIASSFVWKSALS